MSPDGSVAFALRTSYEAPSHPVRIDLETGETTALRSPAATPELPGTLTEVETTAEDGRRVRAWLALPKHHGEGPAAPLDPRRSAGVVERVVVAVEPVDPRRARVRGPAARPGAVHRLRPGLRAGRLGGVGRGAVHRPDGHHRRGGGARRHRRDADGRDGRLVRRLHGQLGRGAHRPVQGDRHARQPVGAGPVRPDDGRGLLLGARDDRRDGARELAAPVRREDRHADARRARRQGLPGAHRRGAAPLVRAAVPERAARRRRGEDRAPVPVLPRREPLGAQPPARDRLVPGGGGVPGGARARPDG